MNKLKAIWKIIWTKHFYLITADENLNCNETQSNTNVYTIYMMINKYWKIIGKI